MNGAWPNPADLAHPEVLGWWPALAALAGLHLALLLQQWWWQRRQFVSLSRRRFGPGLTLSRALLKWGLWAAAGWELLLALAVPLGPPQKIEGTQYGADVIFCLDVSSSMLAQDVQPDRLQAAKDALQGILNSMDGDRVGLVGFAGGAVVACPLTTDYDTASLFLDKLDVDCVPRDGTDLASALQMALDGFGATDGPRGRLIVLATDGEDTVDSDVLTEARRARELGVAVECVGVGTTAGALIPGRRDVFGRVYAKMWHGQPVRTRMDPDALRAIAEASGGEYLPADSPRSLARVVVRVRRLKQGLGKSPDRYVRDPLFQGPLLWALALLLADSLISLRGRGWLRLGEGLARALSRRWRPSRALALLLGLGLLGLAASARADLDAGRSAYNAGNDAYRAGDYAGAAQDYQQSIQADPSNEAAYYNLGNALYQQKDYQGALQAYQQAQKLNPDDQDAQDNAQLAQDKLQQKQGGGQGGQGQGGSNGKGQGQGENGQGKGNSGQGQASNPDQSPLKQGQWVQRRPGQREDQNSKNLVQGQSQQDAQGQNGRANVHAQGGPAQQGSAAQAQGSQAPLGPRLTRDQIEAMLNRLRLDQRRYAGAFNPLKRYGRPDQQPQDPMQQLMQQFTGIPMGPTPQPQQQEDPDYKDW